MTFRQEIRLKRIFPELDLIKKVKKHTLDNSRVQGPCLHNPRAGDGGGGQLAPLRGGRENNLIILSIIIQPFYRWQGTDLMSEKLPITPNFYIKFL